MYCPQKSWTGNKLLKVELNLEFNKIYGIFDAKCSEFAFSGSFKKLMFNTKEKEEMNKFIK